MKNQKQQKDRLLASAAALEPTNFASTKATSETDCSSQATYPGKGGRVGKGHWSQGGRLGRVHRRQERGTADDEDHVGPLDSLVPDPQVWREFGVTSMTLYRWTRDPNLGFPQPIKIRNRCFRSRRALEEFKKRMMRASIVQRSRKMEKA